jgi:hypothetical protein
MNPLPTGKSSAMGLHWPGVMREHLLPFYPMICAIRSRQSMQASTCFCIADRTRKRSAKAQLADHLLQMLLERLIWMAVQRESSAQSHKKAAPIGRPFRKWT